MRRAAHRKAAHNQPVWVHLSGAEFLFAGSKVLENFEDVRLSRPAIGIVPSAVNFEHNEGLVFRDVARVVPGNELGFCQSSVPAMQ